MTDEDIRNRNMKMPKYECTPALGSAASLCEEPHSMVNSKHIM